MSAQKYKNSGGGAVKVKVIEELLHPNFNRYTLVYDFNLFRIDEAVELDTDIVLTLNKDPAFPGLGENLTVAGMGQTTYGGLLPDVLNDVEVQYISNEECNDMMTGTVTDSMFCANVEGGGKDACIGDSGGPIVFRDGNNHTLVGLVSWGYQCALPDTAGVYSRITSGMDWIIYIVCDVWQTMADFCPDPTPAPTVSMSPSMHPTMAPTLSPAPSLAPTKAPSPAPSLTPTDAPTSNCTSVRIEFMTDRWPEENSYQLARVDKSLRSNDPGATTLVWNETSFNHSTEYTRETCLPGYPNETCAVFSFNDSLGVSCRHIMVHTSRPDSLKDYSICASNLIVFAGWLVRLWLPPCHDGGPHCI